MKKMISPAPASCGSASRVLRLLFTSSPLRPGMGCYIVFSTSRSCLPLAPSSFCCFPVFLLFLFLFFYFSLLLSLTVLSSSRTMALRPVGCHFVTIIQRSNVMSFHVIVSFLDVFFSFFFSFYPLFSPSFHSSLVPRLVSTWSCHVVSAL